MLFLHRIFAELFAYCSHFICMSPETMGDVNHVKSLEVFGSLDDDAWNFEMW